MGRPRRRYEINEEKKEAKQKSIAVKLCRIHVLCKKWPELVSHVRQM